MLVRREDYAYKLAKALELKGLGPALDLDERLVPVVVVEDVTEGNEQDYAVHRWCRGHGTCGLGVAFGKLSFNNQVGSGVIIRIWKLRIHHSGMTGVFAAAPVPLLHPSGLIAGGKVGFTMETASTGGTQVNFTKRFTDARLDVGPSARLPALDIRKDNSGGIGSHYGQPFVSVEGLDIDLGGMFLLPGTRLHFEGLDADAPFDAFVEWTETNI